MEWHRQLWRVCTQCANNVSFENNAILDRCPRALKASGNNWNFIACSSRIFFRFERIRCWVEGRGERAGVGGKRIISGIFRTGRGEIVSWPWKSFPSPARVCLECSSRSVNRVIDGRNSKLSSDFPFYPSENLQNGRETYLSRCCW